MDLAECKQELEGAIARNESIVLAAQCEIWYSGRAESYLPEGDRILIIKEDKTLLVHQPTGNNPVNYMKPGTAHSLSLDNGMLSLNSQNLPEYMDIRITKVHFLSSSQLTDNKSIEIAGTEKDMADTICSNPELIEPGFKPLSQEEHTKYGFIDVFGYDKDNILTVVECKRYRGDLQAVTQLRRYVEKIKEAKGVSQVRGILACPKISPNALSMLQDWGFSFAAVEPPKYLRRYGKDQKTLDSF